jgi:hypothetical protein
VAGFSLAWPSPYVGAAMSPTALSPTKYAIRNGRRTILVASLVSCVRSSLHY